MESLVSVLVAFLGGAVCLFAFGFGAQLQTAILDALCHEHDLDPRLFFVAYYTTKLITMGVMPVAAIVGYVLAVDYLI